ncbi:MAG: hypothetical protein ABJA33_10715 [Pedococcus sp.]
MNTTTIRRCIVAGVVVGISIPGFAACGAEIAPPAQDISRVTPDKQHHSVPMPTRTTGNRSTFGDEYGTAKVKARKAQPLGGGTRNRMNFRDDGR